MEAHAFFEIANYLRRQRPDGYAEAADRTAVSRIYYAAFLSARGRMEAWGCRFSRSGKVHAQVIEGLKFSRVVPIAQIGMNIGKLHERRKAADYDIEEEFEPDFERVHHYYQVAVSLDEKWGYVQDGKKLQALENMKNRIAEIESNS